MDINSKKFNNAVDALIDQLDDQEQIRKLRQSRFAIVLMHKKLDKAAWAIGGTLILSSGMFFKAYFAASEYASVSRSIAGHESASLLLFQACAIGTLGWIALIFGLTMPYQAKSFINFVESNSDKLP